MSKNLILDWQKNSLMLARANGRAPKVSVENVVMKSVGGAEIDSQTSAEALRSAAQELSVKGEVTVLVARELVEMRTVQIPMIDPDDLPDVIRFQAQRQFASMSDAWTVDYLMLPSASGNELQTALVAAISPAQLNEIDSACAAAGLQATKISLRPVLTAQFAVDGGLIPSSGQAVVICVSESMVDILILRQGKIVQVRTTKLPSEKELVATALQGELRRSLFAASAELDGKSIEHVVLVATAPRSDELAKAIEPVFNCKVVQFHPEALLVDSNVELADSIGNRLTAAAGALTLEAAASASVINFKNPKKRPPKKRDTRKYILAAAAAASLLLLGVGWYYSTVKELDARYNQAQEEMKSLKSLADANQRRLAEMNAIQQFAQGSPNWLDELAVLAEKIPSSDKVMMDSPVFTLASNTNAGLIRFNLLLSDKSSDSEFRDSLQADNYIVMTNTTSELPKAEGKYRYRSDGLITITNKGWDLNAQPSQLKDSGPKDESQENSNSEAGSSSDKTSDGSVRLGSSTSGPASGPRRGGPGSTSPGSNPGDGQSSSEQPAQNSINVQPTSERPSVNSATASDEAPEKTDPGQSTEQSQVQDSATSGSADK